MSYNLNEFDIMRNSALGAQILYEFTKRYIESNKEQLGPILPFIFPVLPIVLTKEYAKDIAKRQYSIGSLFKVLTSDNTIFLNLNERMVELSETTFRSLNICFSSNILAYDVETTRIYNIKKVNFGDFRTYSENYQNIIKATLRLGTWFSKLKDEELLSYFNLTF